MVRQVRTNPRTQAPPLAQGSDCPHRRYVTQASEQHTSPSLQYRPSGDQQGNVPNNHPPSSHTSHPYSRTLAAPAPVQRTGPYPVNTSRTLQHSDSSGSTTGESVNGRISLLELATVALETEECNSGPQPPRHRQAAGGHRPLPQVTGWSPDHGETRGGIPQRIGTMERVFAEPANKRSYLFGEVNPDVVRRRQQMGQTQRQTDNNPVSANLPSSHPLADHSLDPSQRPRTVEEWQQAAQRIIGRPQQKIHPPPLTHQAQTVQSVSISSRVQDAQSSRTRQLQPANPRPHLPYRSRFSHNNYPLSSPLDSSPASPSGKYLPRINPESRDVPSALTGDGQYRSASTQVSARNGKGRQPILSRMVLDRTARGIAGPSPMPMPAMPTTSLPQRWIPLPGLSQSPTIVPAKETPDPAAQARRDPDLCQQSPPTQQQPSHDLRRHDVSVNCEALTDVAGNGSGDSSADAHDLGSASESDSCSDDSSKPLFDPDDGAYPNDRSASLATSIRLRLHAPSPALTRPSTHTPFSDRFTSTSPIRGPAALSTDVENSRHPKRQRALSEGDQDALDSNDETAHRKYRRRDGPKRREQNIKAQRRHRVKKKKEQQTVSKELMELRMKLEHTQVELEGAQSRNNELREKLKVTFGPVEEIKPFPGE